MRQLKSALTESIGSVLPIAAIVFVLSVTIAPINAGVLVLFIFGTFLLILGMSLFTIGSEISMEPLGESIGVVLGKHKRIVIPAIICLVLGVLVTVAEPDLQVLAEQVPSIPNAVFIWCVAIGAGVFLAVAVIRARKNIPLARLLLIFYVAAMILAFFVSDDFVATAFDSGGVTTGPVTVPFIIALGAGMAAQGNKKNSSDNSFGLIALCSIGPVLAVLVLSICFKPEPETSSAVVAVAETTKDAFLALMRGIPEYGKEVFMSFLPVIGIFLLFQLLTRRFQARQMIKISFGLLYTYIGIVLFLTGANVGFMPAGKLIGAEIAQSGAKYWLIPVGMVVGYFIVTAEPAVHSLKKQVEEVTNGAISQRAMELALSVGVAVSVGISMLRVITGISILPFLIVGYSISLIIMFFVPPIYTGIAFDSGGVASGSLTTAFILPLALGACEVLGGNVMQDAFGVVALVAMTPLITIQVMGLSARVKQRSMIRKARRVLVSIDNDIMYYDCEDSTI
ncbi:MAG: DUF1538 domain-containing protein [Clostridia bacterium]|nr:DUF1538 domain-containing protein [Clostridia bacterium]